jgi:dihydroorotate dehydrogenase
VGQAGRLGYALARPALFALDAERAHRLTLAALDCVAGAPILRMLATGALAGAPVRDPVDLLGLRFPNPVGLAAGLDKDAQHVDGLAALGFGFLELGTVTPLAQPGNPRPRLFRLPAAGALINRFGFNNEGLEPFVARVRGSRTWTRRRAGDADAPPLGINIGKNAVTPIERAVDDYLACLRAAMPVADYVTINVSSPNTRNLRQLQSGEQLGDLLGAIDAERARLLREGSRQVPVLTKIAPDLDDGQLEVIAALLVRHAIDGVIATNTTLARDAVAGLRHGAEAGGLSGRPVFEPSNRVIRALRSLLPPRYPIIGVGGIMSADDAVAKLGCGADLVQLYTGLVYRGPALVGECAAAVAAARANGGGIAA